MVGFLGFEVVLFLVVFGYFFLYRGLVLYLDSKYLEINLNLFIINYFRVYIGMIIYIALWSIDTIT